MPRLSFACALTFVLLQVSPVNAATFYFIRHAESAANAGTATTVEEYVNPGLTDLGEQQALDLVDQLMGLDVRTIYTSAYQRTQLTIAPTASYFGLTPTVDARTNEWYFGDADSLSDLGGAGIGDAFSAWAAGDTAAKPNLPNSESLDDLIARVLPAWQEIIEAHKDDEGDVLLVGHGATMGYVMPYLAANVDPAYGFAHRPHNTGIIQLDLINGTPYVTSWEGTAFDANGPVAPVPLPASGLLLLGGSGALAACRAMRKKRSKAAA